MARFPSTSSAPSGSLGRVDDGVIGSVHPGLRPNVARSALEDEVNCQLVDVPGPLAHWPGPPFNVHPLGGTRRGVFEAELAAQARPPGSPLGPPEVPVCAQGPNQVCRLDDIDRTQGASAGMAYTDARARPRDDRQREGGTHTGVHVAVQLRRRFLCAASGRSGHETRSVMVRLGEGDGGSGSNTISRQCRTAATPRPQHHHYATLNRTTTPLTRHFRRGARWRGVLRLQVVALNGQPAFVLRDVPRRVSGRCCHR